MSILAIPAAILRWQIDQIFIVNIIGCFLLGVINSLNVSKNEKLIFGFGFCGSLTTFSGWTFMLFELISRGHYKQFFLTSTSLALIGLFAVCFGHILAKQIEF